MGFALVMTKEVDTGCLQAHSQWLLVCFLSMKRAFFLFYFFCLSSLLQPRLCSQSLPRVRTAGYEGLISCFLKTSHRHHSDQIRKQHPWVPIKWKWSREQRAGETMALCRPRHQTLTSGQTEHATLVPAFCREILKREMQRWGRTFKQILKTNPLIFPTA